MLKTLLIAAAALGGAILGSPAIVMAQSLERAMATYYRGDYADAMKAMTPLAEAGDRHAQYLIGFMHDRGQGVPKDDAQAAKWYGQAAERGHPFAQNNLGVLYKNGRGVPKDPVAAYMWFSLAADGYLPAEFGNRQQALTNREDVVAQMSTAQLAEAKRRVEEHRAREPGLPEYRPPNIR